MKRLESRESADVLKHRLIGKRIVSADRHITDYPSWKQPPSSVWEPRVYFCSPLGEGFDEKIRYESQPASRLLRLPAEIRNHILEYAVQPQKVSQEAGCGGQHQQEGSQLDSWTVLFCCKQLYHEARKLAVEHNTVDYETLPRKTRLCCEGNEEGNYVWDR
ncbi:hypothetical protein BDV96DRAFT_370989 [Lophiotrema nucula]|uniref:F-box domain-containing protein n=1 Tax=Lophiotrema nucula TaxID=690887 RepID=A0A6A5ZJ01_9PLEO|nr:hypothetical protein BDV96DRAFT_370989 [Lophiotrema nucula]